MLSIDQELDLTIESIAYRGAGVARHEGLVVFVPGVAPAERVRARIARLHRNYAEGDLLVIHEPSPDRIAPCCRLPDGTRVPGCVYDHLAYPAEVALKQRQVEEILTRLPGCAAVPFAPPVPSPLSLHYRNKIVLHAQSDRNGGALRLGYFGDDNRTVVDIPACPLAREELNAALAAWRPSTDGRVRDGQSLTLRWTPTDGVVAWLDDQPAHHPDLIESTPLGPLRVPLGSFYQVNPEIADALVRQVVAWCLSGEGAGADILDLYCGVGVFGLACAQAGASRVRGIESGRTAVAAAAANAKHLGLAADFRCQVMTQAARNGFGGINRTCTTVIVDPPRQGLEPEVVRGLVAGHPPRLLYISCDPATLARDLRLLLAAGYSLKRARLFDMFPRTAHFETAVWLEAAG